MDSRVWVYAMDGSQASELPFEMTHGNIQPEDEIHFVHIHNPGTDDSKIAEQFRPEAIEKKWSKFIEDSGFQNAQFHIIESVYISKAICDFAASVNATILVVGADGMQKYYSESDKQLIGSVTDLCVKDAPCPIFVGQLMETQTLHD